MRGRKLQRLISTATIWRIFLSPEPKAKLPCYFNKLLRVILFHQMLNFLTKTHLQRIFSDIFLMPMEMDIKTSSSAQAGLNLQIIHRTTETVFTSIMELAILLSLRCYFLPNLPHLYYQ